MGTVSGAPKIRVIQLISELEREERDPYAGTVGRFAYNRIQDDGKIADGDVDTYIAIRTMLAQHDAVVHLQAGGGIVYDSDEFEEWTKTVNKLSANIQYIELAEKRFGGRRDAKTTEEIVHELKEVGPRL